MILLADAVLHALMAIKSSINMSLTGSEAVCRMYTSASRTESLMVMNVSPFENFVLARLEEPVEYPTLLNVRTVEETEQPFVTHLFETALASSGLLLPRKRSLASIQSGF